MSTGWLFGVGVVVTLLVAIGLALPIYGAILDGRYEAEQRLGAVHELTRKRRGRPAA